MANFNILLAFSFFIVLTMFDHSISKSNGDIKNCTKHLSMFGNHSRNRTCTADEESEMLICYPAVLSEGQYNRKGYMESDEDRVHLKPSRRFSILINESEVPGTCATEEESCSYKKEFTKERYAFLDDYHQLFLDLVAHVTGWPGCGKRFRANATMPYLLSQHEHSFKLNRALRDGCTIAITAELLSKYEETRQFVIELLQNYPEPIPGLSERMFAVTMTDNQIKLETRLWYKKQDYRTLFFDSKRIELKIKLVDNNYVVFLDDQELDYIANRDHPLWAINYTYITGDLKLGKNPVEVDCDPPKKPAWDAPLIDWSNKLDDKKPTELELLDLEFRGPRAAVNVYLLRGCPKFNMTVCLHAMEYKLSYSEKNIFDSSGGILMKTSLITINVTVYRRRDPYRPAGENYTVGTLKKKILNHFDKYNLTISVDKSQQVGLKLQGDKWRKKTLEHMERRLRFLKTPNWRFYTHECAEFVQILTEGEVDIGDWHLRMAPRPVASLNGDKKFEAGKTSPPWHAEHKLTNWTNGDYIKLHIKMLNNFTDTLIWLYRGYPGWFHEYYGMPDIDDFGQIMLLLTIDWGEIRFRAPFCEWTSIRVKRCTSVNWLPSEDPFFPEDDVALFQTNQKHVIHIKSYENGFKVDVFDTKQKLLATYKPAVYIPYYTVEYFNIDGAILLMEKPKFCKASDTTC